jgi:hypothetical protein
MECLAVSADRTSSPPQSFNVDTLVQTAQNIAVPESVTDHLDLTKPLDFAALLATRPEAE